MSDYKALLEQIDETPSSAELINLYERAIRLADRDGLTADAFYLRQDLITECNEYGYFMKAIVAFSHNLGRVDEGEFDFDYNMVWDYKAVLARIAAFDSISMTQINDMLEDFRLRMRANGATDSAYNCRRLRIAFIPKDKEMASDAKKALITGKRDSHTDCKACLQHHYVEYELSFGDYNKALNLYEPIKSGKIGCNMTPLRTYAYLVNPAHRHGDAELAKKASEKGIQLIGNKSGFLELIGFHLIYLSEMNRRKGINLFKKALLWALNETQTPWSVMNFNLGAYLLFARLSAERPKGKIMLPQAYPLHTASGDYVYQDLAEHHRSEYLKRAEQFDQRNGNNYYTELLKEEENRL